MHYFNTSITEILTLLSFFSYQVQLHARMDRGFFRADQDWTCYRRNYFQVSSTFDVHGMNYMIQGPEVPCLLRKSSDSQELLQRRPRRQQLLARVLLLHG